MAAQSGRAYDMCVRGRNLWTQSRAANNEGIGLFRQALALEPGYAEAHWRLALSHLFCWLQYGEPMEANHELSLSAVASAIRLDPHDSGARWANGFILAYDRRWEDARREFQISIAMNPNDADARSIYSDFLFLDGKAEEALESAAMAMRLNPFPPGWHIWLFGQALIACGKFDEAVAILSKEVTYRSSSRRILAVALALSGRKEEALYEAQSYLATDPGWRYGPWMATRPFQNSQDIDFWNRAYEMAGFAV